jgi:hypothetical protein
MYVPSAAQLSVMPRILPQSWTLLYLSCFYVSVDLPFDAYDSKRYLVELEDLCKLLRYVRNYRDLTSNSDGLKKSRLLLTWEFEGYCYLIGFAPSLGSELVVVCWSGRKKYGKELVVS